MCILNCEVTVDRSSGGVRAGTTMLVFSTILAAWLVAFGNHLVHVLPGAQSARHALAPASHPPAETAAGLSDRAERHCAIEGVVRDGAVERPASVAGWPFAPRLAAVPRVPSPACGPLARASPSERRALLGQYLN